MHALRAYQRELPAESGPHAIHAYLRPASFPRWERAYPVSYVYAARACACTDRDPAACWGSPRSRDDVHVRTCTSTCVEFEIAFLSFLRSFKNAI